MTEINRKSFKYRNSVLAMSHITFQGNTVVVPMTARVLLQALHSYACSFDRVRVHQSTLSVDLGMDVNHLAQNIKFLQDLGLIKVKGHYEPFTYEVNQDFLDTFYFHFHQDRAKRVEALIEALHTD